MFRVVPRAICQIDSLVWHCVETRCGFATSTAWKVTWSKDPVKRQEQYAARRERYRTDPEFNARARLSRRVAQRKLVARYSEEQHNYMNLRKAFRELIKGRVDSGEILVWKTHVVEYTHDKNVHRCVSCERERLVGSRLWWRRIQDGAYECFPCFTKDMSRAIPLGYENWLSSITSKHEKARRAASKRSPTKPDPDSDPSLDQLSYNSFVYLL